MNKMDMFFLCCLESLNWFECYKDPSGKAEQAHLSFGYK